MTRLEKLILTATTLGAACALLWSFSTLNDKIDDMVYPAPVACAVEERHDKTGVLETIEAAKATEPIETTEAVELENLGTFKLTAYCACERCCEEWADGITYTGTVATEGRTVAVDPDVIPLGSTVYIDGVPYIAEDIGGAVQENVIDIFFSDHETALQFGVQYAEVSIEKP